MNWEERITADPAILVGKPVLRGTRLAVEFIVGLLADGWSEADIITNYPGVSREDCRRSAFTLRAPGRAYPGQ